MRVLCVPPRPLCRRRRPPVFWSGVVVEVVFCWFAAAVGEGVGVKDALRAYIAPHGPLWEGRIRFHVSPPALSRSRSFRLRHSPPECRTTTAFAARVIPAPPFASELVRRIIVNDDHSLTSKLFGIFSVCEEEQRERKKGLNVISYLHNRFGARTHVHT